MILSPLNLWCFPLQSEMFQVDNIEDTFCLLTFLEYDEKQLKSKLLSA